MNKNQLLQGTLDLLVLRILEIGPITAGESPVDCSRCRRTA